MRSMVTLSETQITPEENQAILKQREQQQEAEKRKVELAEFQVRLDALCQEYKCSLEPQRIESPRGVSWQMAIIDAA